MDMREYLRIQKEFYDKIDAKDKRNELAKTKDYLLAMISEATELLECLDGWKVHRTVVDSKKHNASEEVVDVLKYLLNIVIALGIDESKLAAEFVAKSQVVEQRFAQEQVLKTIQGKKIAVVDIDNVLCDFDRSMTNAYNRRHETDYSFDEVVRQKDYAEFQARYRSEGLKEGAAADPHASLFTQKLHELGYTVLILSSRPQHIYSSIYSSTLKWLKANNIYFDALAFSQNKVAAILDYMPSVKAIVDDDELVIKSLKSLVPDSFIVGNGKGQTWTLLGVISQLERNKGDD